MASLYDAVKDNANELREGIPWVVFWREGRSWNSEAIFFSMDYAADTIDPDDIGHLEYINHTDPRAIALNGYYCGRLGEDMTLDELTRGVRWHYENNFNTLAAFIEEHSPFLPPEQLEAAQEAAHAAGLPFSDRPDGRDIDRYVYDGSMTPEDYTLMHELMTQERSKQMDDFTYLEAYISNLGKYTENEPAGEWVRFPTTAEHLKTAFDHIGIDGKNYEEWHITQYNSDIAGLTRHLSEFESLDELNYLGKLLEMQRDSDKDIFAAAVMQGEYAGSVKDLINLAQNLDCYWLYPTVHSEEDYGYYLIDELEAMELPEAAKKYFDYEAYGRDSIINEGGEITEQGYIFNNKNTFTEWYEGRDVPEEYRVTPQFSQPEQQRPDPIIEYDTIATRAPAVATVRAPEFAADKEQPQPVKVIALESEKPAEKLKEITDKLEQGIASIFESEQYKDYLKTLSKFHDYSLNNTILIAMQKPDASYVAGFNTWKKEFERNVRKGEKGIKIIAPSPYKVKVQQEKTDAITGKPVIGADGKPVTEEIERKIPAYKVVSVFDVSQTEGKELPTIGVDVLTGDVEQYKDFFATLEKVSPVPIAFENIDGSANGYYHQVDKRIAIDEGMSELQTLKTTIHEIAHARLHDVDMNNEQDEQPRADRRTREVEAESIAYTVCQHYGLDTSDYSFGYVAGWSSGKELAELKASLETIRNTAAELITEIDGHFVELQQGKEQTAEQEQQPAPEQERQQGDTYTIYQLKGDDSTRDFRLEPYERLQAAGLSVEPSNYVFVYSGQLGRDETLDSIYEKFNISRPADFTGHSLSISDVVTLNRDGKETAHYVDRFGFKDVPEFLQPDPAFDMQQTAAEPVAPDDYLTGEKIKTPRGSFSLTDMTAEQMKAAGYGYHHSSDDNKYHIMGNGTRAFAIINPLRTAEMSTEQNYSMIDGIHNNRPTVDELEARAKAGEQINLSDLAATIKAERSGADQDTDKKPSIRAQLKAAAQGQQKENTPQQRSREKSPGLEV
ncbi:MAG: antirestriction protein ArdA [Sporomusa sp.]